MSGLSVVAAHLGLAAPVPATSQRNLPERRIERGGRTRAACVASDGKGKIWFTSPGSNRFGRSNVETGRVNLVTPWRRRRIPVGR